ncbi:glycosyltransferase family 4 protein [Parvibium lacunae]|uniref:Glycosyltransferase WbuB n=1 Tax=Parvibium lacunae TaxID=1888893 RepID=A0A368L1H3_9BURK|nr:glycosyltransferase family 4 protein [Parvibium lacunae]RCS57416.1 glycosyltransferase WbuB [Parvibium lacunae]
MRIALIADTFPPLRTSGAVQLRDLTREFVRQGHAVTVMLPASDLPEPWRLEDYDGATILRLKAPQTKDIGYIRRTINEFIMPFSMAKQLKKSPLANERWDGIVWYAPSIFHGPLISRLKKISRCKSYLIVRDIFPEWAVDMGLMGKGMPYLFFKAVARYQYAVADVIGIQTPGNRQYFKYWIKQSGHQLEVLQNWLAEPAQLQCSIRVNQTSLAGRKVLVYAGNMGIAQGMGILLDLAEKLLNRTDIGFLFVGRGSDLNRLKASAKTRKLDNTLFFDEIDPDEIPDLYAQCSAGIVALDFRHKSHNIPGKFLTYMQCGLPVLANVNAGNDLAEMIRQERVGQVCETNEPNELLEAAGKLLNQLDADPELSERCTNLFRRQFAVEKTSRQIVSALMS